VVTLSSGEAELYGVVRGGAVGLGFLSLLSDLGVQLPMRLWTDSSASQGMCARQGLGKVRHLDVQELWVQQRLRNGEFSLHKVPGEENPADLFTKGSLTHHRIETLLNMLSCKYEQGRALSAPSLRRKSPEAGKPLWGGDFDDEPYAYDSNQHAEFEVTEMLKKVGLPHSRSENYKAEDAVEPYPETEETEDALVSEGYSLGQNGAGRKPLPTRLRATLKSASK